MTREVKVYNFSDWNNLPHLLLSEKDEQYEYLVSVDQKKVENYESRIDELMQEQEKAQVNIILPLRTKTVSALRPNPSEKKGPNFLRDKKSWFQVKLCEIYFLSTWIQWVND